ncbi:co-chaperone GroES [Staphylococcus gallinarum]|uniref:co-chaperone GroES n=1 Tax=Staphylococcus gallinarum TaxID=1293 RepID=UPI000D1C7C55|nr:co-chaperone GroES [Staphylococcus gallinarum]MBU7218799.1 co-chaperone GroES [Staphylococcus gallinarum]MCD8794834.1 co-chaperone GroES [Staphylococcus gallinarum]MCD8872665.1 co-chaperone GroES [Staphylococcus gallinarum]MCW0986694.1 co-chaperone GroES [Staphylococcus gallinarum]MDN6414900.1 co-chaperone GroES [Staphylococcus gallinarum]
MLKPLNNQIIIKQKENEGTTKSGIVLTDSAQENNYEGEVIAIGPGSLLNDGSRKKPEVNVGDYVIYKNYAGTKVDYNDESFLVISENDVLAIIE